VRMLALADWRRSSCFLTAVAGLTVQLRDRYNRLILLNIGFVHDAFPSILLGSLIAADSSGQVDEEGKDGGQDQETSDSKDGDHRNDRSRETSNFSRHGDWWVGIDAKLLEEDLLVYGVGNYAGIQARQTVMGVRLQSECIIWNSRDTVERLR
jgi:hypothetical protein